MSWCYSERIGPKKCIFCGGAPVTNEHVYSREWIKRIFPGRHDQVLAYLPSGQQPVWHQFTAHGPEVVARCVCRDCNNGWMNDLDLLAQPVLEPLVSSLERRLLSLEDQRVLATWATKIAMVLDYAPKPLGIVKPAAHKRLYDERLPPNEAYVWLAARSGTDPFLDDYVGFKTGPPPMQYRMYVASIQVGYAVFQVFLPDPDSNWLPIREGFADSVIQLWPLTFKPVSWTPAGILDDNFESLRTFAHSLGSV